MSNIVVFVNYEVKSDKRESYLDLMKEIKSIITLNSDIQYNVFESKNKSNFFSEVFRCETRESFNTFNRLAASSNNLNFLLKEVDKCIKNYVHITEEKLPIAA